MTRWYSHVQDFFVWAVTFSYVLWLLHMCHDASSCVTSLIHMRTWLADIHAHPHSYAPWLIHTCHDSIVCAMTPLVCMRTWLVDIHVHPHSSAPRLFHMCHDWFVCAMAPKIYMRTWPDNFRGHLHTHLRHDSFIYAITHLHVWHHSYMCDTTRAQWLSTRADMTHWYPSTYALSGWLQNGEYE